MRNFFLLERIVCNDGSLSPFYARFYVYRYFAPISRYSPSSFSIGTSTENELLLYFGKEPKLFHNEVRCRVFSFTKLGASFSQGENELLFLKFCHRGFVPQTIISVPVLFEKGTRKLFNMEHLQASMTWRRLLP